MTSAVESNEMTRFFIKLNKITYLLGLPNFWVEDVDVPLAIKKIHYVYRMATNIVFVFLIVFEWAAFFTQNNLTEKQTLDRVMFGFSHPSLFIFLIILEFHKERISKTLYELVVVLKEVHNDEEIERQMIKKSYYNSIQFSMMFMMAIAFYGFDGVMQVLRGDGTFTTIITFWPDVAQSSLLASIARVTSYFIWWIFMSRVCGVYVLTIPVTICLSHQLKNLQSYFYSLRDIFNEDLDQTEMENKYEEAYKLGIKMHSDTLWCIKSHQRSFSIIFSIQVLTAVAVLVLLMSQMVQSERTLENVLSIVSTGSTMLISSGFFMWNAGDITVEAEALATAMYSSGWEHCQRSSLRLRRLLIITMTQAQKPVVLWALGIIELSYHSYVSLVKSSYSVFSVLY